MNRLELMNYSELMSFSGKEAIVKVWRNDNNLAVLTKGGSYHLKSGGVWYKDDITNVKDFVMTNGRILALTFEGFLIFHPLPPCVSGPLSAEKGVITFNRFKFLYGISFTKIAIGKTRCFALAQDGKLCEWWSENSVTYYELDWSTCDETEPEDKTVTLLKCAWCYPMVLTKGGKLFIPMFPEEPSKFIGIRHQKLQTFGTILINKKVVELSVGSSFVFALTDQGEVYKWKPKEIPHNACPEKIDYKCHQFQTKGISIWAPESRDSLVIFLESGSLVFVCLSGEGDVLAKSISSSRAAFVFFDYFGDCNGCLYDQPNRLINTEEIQLKDKWMSKLKDVFNVKEGSDLIIEVERKPIYCHKIIISAHCEFLKNCIKNRSLGENENLNENNLETLRLQLDSFKYETIYSILKYFYTGRLEFQSFDTTLELVELTEMWLEEDIQKSCVDQLIKWLSIENVHLAKEKVDRLLAARFNQALQDLKETCLFLNPDIE